MFSYFTFSDPVCLGTSMREKTRYESLPYVCLPLNLFLFSKVMHEQYEKPKREDTGKGSPRSVGAQYATGDQWRNNSRQNEEMEPKHKQHQLWM